MRILLASRTCVLVFARFTLSHVHDLTTVLPIEFSQVGHLVLNTLLTESFVEHVASAVRYSGSLRKSSNL